MNSPWLDWSDPLEDSNFQGIEFLEIELGAPPNTQPAAKLHIHLQRPLDRLLTAADLTITGGQTAVFSEKDWTIQPHALSTRKITIFLNFIGDRSPYTVTLLEDPLREATKMPIHPFFASARFVFYVDCAREDCRAPIESPPKQPKQRPAIDLLTKDYAGFMTLLGDWVRVKNPHWADLSPASLERVLVELLAHHGDMLSYYQDRVANEAFIETASQRYSLRQHAVLLGAHLFDGAAATTILAFTGADGYVPEGTEVTIAAGAGDAEVVFHTTDPARVTKDHGHLKLAAWPKAFGARVRAGATEMLLWGNHDKLIPGQQIAIVQAFSTQVVPFAQIVTLTAIRHQKLPGWTDSPGNSPSPDPDVTIVTFSPPLERDVWPWDAERPFFIYGNLGQARFGRKRTAIFDLVEAQMAADRQNFAVEQRSGFSGAILRALRLPEVPVVFQSETTPTGQTVCSPMVYVEIDGLPWYRVDHFHNSRSYDRHYVATADEDGSLWLEFGDGKSGRRVELAADIDENDSRLRVDYRVGVPIAGNIGAGVLTRFVPGQPNIDDFQVVNVLPGTGGSQPESREAARLRIPASLRTGLMQRAVTLADYANAAVGVSVGHQRIARATAKLVGGAFNTVLVLVDPEAQVELSQALEQAVYDRIEALRMAGREHFVKAPDYVPIEVVLGICVQPGALPHRVRDAVLAALRPGTKERPGFFHPDRLSFGDELEVGQVLACVQRIAGVRSVKALRFRKLGIVAPNFVETRIKLGSTEVVRMDGDELRPSAGRLSVLLVGIDAGISEKDFVIEEAP